MKQERGFFAAINSWPEEARQIFVGILFLVCALALFGLWNFNLASRLENFSEENFAGEATKQNQYETKILTPLAGIAETFRSLRALLNY